jgi:predicted NBD/HSP70 family sugar kinase
MLHQQPLSVEAMSGGAAGRFAGAGHYQRRRESRRAILAIMVNLFNPQKILIGSRSSGGGYPFSGNFRLYSATIVPSLQPTYCR